MIVRSVCGAGLLTALVAVGTDAAGQTPKPGTQTKPTTPPKVGVAPVVGGPAVGVAPPAVQPPPIRLGVYVQPAAGGGLYIHSVVAGFPAQQIGLETGDVLVSINNRATNTVDDMRWAIDNAINTNAGQVTLLVKDVRGTGFVNLSATIAWDAPQVGAVPVVGAAPKQGNVVGAAPRNPVGAAAKNPVGAAPAPQAERKIKVSNVKRAPVVGGPAGTPKKK